jgi:hypothetical protein
MNRVTIEIPKATFDRALAMARARGSEDVSDVIDEAIYLLSREEAIQGIARLDRLRRGADTDRAQRTQLEKGDEMTDQLPQWYLDEALPRLKRVDELTPVAYPNIQPQDPEGKEKMLAAREEWGRLMREQTIAERDAGL